jgi:flagellum-specific ATP synthase
MKEITYPEHRRCALEIQEALATYKEAEDLISIGAYQKRSNPKIDRAIALYADITRFLRQDVEDTSSLSDTIEQLMVIARS